MPDGLKVLIAGGSGLIGRCLANALVSSGCEVRILTRKRTSMQGFYQWDVEQGLADELAFLDVDAIFNLAGAGIASRPWTKRRKEILRSSRLNATRLIAESCRKLDVYPVFYAGASAIGYYGHAPGRICTEDQNPGSGFLAELCSAWEEEHIRMKDIAQNILIARISNVVSDRGGFMIPWLYAAKCLLKLRIHKMENYLTWIHEEDLVSFLTFAMQNRISGIYNMAASYCTWREFQNSIRLPSAAIPLNIPAGWMRLAMGEMSDLLFHECRAPGDKMNSTSFRFKYPDLQSALVSMK